MRVLEQPKSDWKTKKTCPKCGAVLEVDAEDLSACLDEGDGPTQPGGWRYTARCPIQGCYEMLYIDVSQAPPYVLIAAQQRQRHR